MVSGGDASFDGRLLSRKTSVCTHSTQNAEENFQGASTNSERTKVQDGSYDSKTFKPPPPPCSPPNPTVPSSVRETPKPEMPVLKGHEPRRLMTLSPCLPETDALVHRKSLMSSRISDLDRRKYGQSTIIKDGILEKWTNYLGAWRARYFILEPGVLKYANTPGQPIKETYPLLLCSTRFCPGDSMRLEVEHSQGVLYLRMPSPAEKKSWIDALLKAKHAFQQQHNSVGISPPMLLDTDSAARHSPPLGLSNVVDPSYSASSNAHVVFENSKRCSLENEKVAFQDLEGNKSQKPITTSLASGGFFKQSPGAKRVSFSAITPCYLQTSSEEKSPMACLLEHCQSYCRSLQSVGSDLRRAQSSFLRLAGQIRDPQFRHDVKNTALRLVETLEHFDVAARRYLLASRTLAIDEQQQRRALEHSLQSLARDNYEMKVKLEKIQKEAAAAGDFTTPLTLRENSDIMPKRFDSPDVADAGVPPRSEGSEDTVDALKTKQDAGEIKKLSEFDQAKYRKVLAQRFPDLLMFLPYLNALQEIALLSRDAVLAEDESQLAESESDDEVAEKEEEKQAQATAARTPMVSATDFDDDSEFFDALDDDIVQPVERPAPWVCPTGSVDDDSFTSVGKKSRDPTPLRLLRQRQSEAPVVAGSALQRRTTLPKPRTENTITLWSILKDCIGKDLSRISLPVYFNEPTSFLQRLAEDFQHVDLLNTASNITNPLERLVWVAIFSITPCASTLGRTHKPFNPLLGETFEFSHRGFRFLAEQVGHHPPVTAYSVSTNRFDAWGHLVVKTRFTGKSVEVSIPGPAHIVLKKPGSDEDRGSDHFTLQRCKAIVSNVIFGKLDLEMLGTVLITNHMTGDCALIEYLRQGWWRSREPHVIRGVVFDSSGCPRYSLGGWWSRELWVEELLPIEDDTCVLQHAKEVPHTASFPSLTSRFGSYWSRSEPAKETQTVSCPTTLDENDHAVAKPKFYSRNVLDIKVNWESLNAVPGTRRVIWRCPPPHPQASLFYEFSQYTMELNDLSPDYDPRYGAAMPPTDSRFRMDQRYLEEGLTEKANREKNRLEENQRARARLRLAGEANYKPRWFKRVYDPFTSQLGWVSTDEYWTAKAENDFRGCLNIFE